MKQKKQHTESGLKRVTLEAIKSAKRQLAMGDSGSLGAGAQKLLSRRLSQLERELRDRRRKPPSRTRLKAIARETAEIFSEIFKSLLRYLFIRPSRWSLAPWAS